MENIILGFLTGGSLILAIGPQNLFVIEQGLKKNFIFTITTICAVSDVLLISLGTEDTQHTFMEMVSLHHYVGVLLQSLVTNSPFISA